MTIAIERKEVTCILNSRNICLQYYVTVCLELVGQGSELFGDV